jgi:hypothetical protein
VASMSLIANLKIDIYRVWDSFCPPTKIDVE